MPSKIVVSIWLGCGLSVGVNAVKIPANNENIHAIIPRNEDLLAYRILMASFNTYTVTSSCAGKILV